MVQLFSPLNSHLEKCNCQSIFTTKDHLLLYMLHTGWEYVSYHPADIQSHRKYTFVHHSAFLVLVVCEHWVDFSCIPCSSFIVNICTVCMKSLLTVITAVHQVTSVCHKMVLITGVGNKMPVTCSTRHLFFKHTFFAFEQHL